MNHNPCERSNIAIGLSGDDLLEKLNLLQLVEASLSTPVGKQHFASRCIPSLLKTLYAARSNPSDAMLVTGIHRRAHFTNTLVFTLGTRW